MLCRINTYDPSAGTKVPALSKIQKLGQTQFHIPIRKSSYSEFGTQVKGCILKSQREKPLETVLRRKAMGDKMLANCYKIVYYYRYV